MPLKRLELYNFKSYRGNQIIQFGDAPFTCIIGPNGAGKSNLMDAISFVLGVRSAQLRSTQLRDLVYRGRRAAQLDDENMDVDQETQTQDNEAARTASVMIAYEDDHGREYKFKRSVNTSGQSTYHLNGQPTDYKKYNTQLEKFNILVKAKNFLVFQGDVEGVASQDSRALARLIDRISGSLDYAPAYEAAKAAQEKATEASTTNYAKKRSMLTEAKHFREQKEEVRQWEALRDSKDNMVQRYILWKLYHLTNEINESTKKVEEANDRLTGLRDDLNAKDEALKVGKNKQAQAQLTVRNREAGVKKAEKALEDKKPELLTVDTQIAHSKTKMKRTAALMERVETDETRQAGNLQTLERGAADIKRNMEEAGRRQRQRSQASGRALSATDLEDYRQLRAQANNEAVGERQRAEILRRDLKTQRDALALVQDRITQAERQREKLTGEVEVLSRRDANMQAKVQEISTDRDGIRAKLEQAQAERQRMNIKETEINERLQDAYHKLLQAGVDKQEDERERRLKETLSSLKRIFPGVYGRVVDLCTPATARLSTAVLTVLGRNLDSVVVENEKTAIECIEYMRSQRAGQATFIPLDTIQVRAVPERLRNFTRGARLAIDSIEYQPAVERAMQHACGTAMICDTMDIARFICYEKGQEVKAVTLDGTVIHRSGLITGGQGTSGGRKFNDTDVQNLQRQRDTLVQQLKDLASTRPKEKDDDSLLSSLAKLDAELTIAQDDLEATRLRLNGLRSEREHADSEIRRSDPERQRRERAVAESETQLGGVSDVINQADDAVFRNFCRRIRVTNIREYEDVQLKIAKEESDAIAAFAAQQARIQHQITFETAQLRSTRERLDQLRTVVDREQENVETLEIAREEITAALDGLQHEIERQHRRLSEAQSSYEDASRKVDDLRDTFRKAQRALDKALKEVAAWNGEIEKSASDRHALYRRCRLDDIDIPLLSGRLDRVPLELDATETTMDIDNEDRTQRPAKADDYGLQPDFDVLEEEDRENPSEEVGRDFEEQISKMRADLERLVPNMKAVDRLGDIEADLNEAEEEAEETRRKSKEARDEFQRLKKKRFDLFNAAYNHMSGCIDKIYKDLTKSATFPTGGVGFLSLEDADEPYLSGVKYNVMPPGKRFVEMEQLSGGEKTMAALALLFSIHSFQPAPFFVLDEVDAALDPTNVSKLARYVRNQAEKVQFLIISLKSTLYEHADSLVGVYREQEMNTSSTLTLDLRKYSE